MTRHLLIIGVLTACLCAGGYQNVESQGRAAGLTGTVTSAAEGAMEGVLVGAKAVGSTIKVTVATNRQGRYVFPPERLAPGRYQLSIRATGYDLKDPGIAVVAADKATAVNLQLEKTKNLAAQLMNAEWVASWPGTHEEKQLASRCVVCHSLGVIVRSRHDANGFVKTLHRMSRRSMGSSVANPFDNASSPAYAKDWGAYASHVSSNTVGELDDEGYPKIVSPSIAAQAAYLAKINLGSDPKGSNWKYELKTFPRPTGEETRVIVTEYDLPRPATSPHDAVVDADGMVWYCDFGYAFIGRLNPRTGKVTEWPLPQVRPFPPFHASCLDVALDTEGNPWFALRQQGAIAKFDKKTEKITTWSAPSEYNMLQTAIIMVAPERAPTGRVWFMGGAGAKGPMLHGLDVKTGHIVSYPIPGQYGLEVLPDDNLVVFALGLNKVIHVDTKTGKYTEYTPPTATGGPRRGEVDAQGRAWFAEFNAGKVGMFDPRTKEIKEWPLPNPNWGGAPDPYAVALDKNGDVWAGGVSTDYVVRLNPATGKTTKYLMPTVNHNIRRMNVDRSGKPVVWIGANHHAKIIKIEPLD